MTLAAETTDQLDSNLWTSVGVTTSNTGQRGNAVLKQASVETAQQAGFVQVRGTFIE
jgi:hypothetical protein